MAPCQVDSLKLHRKAPPSKDKQYFPGFFCFSGKIKKKTPNFYVQHTSKCEVSRELAAFLRDPCGSFCRQPWHERARCQQSPEAIVKPVLIFAVY